MCIYIYMIQIIKHDLLPKKAMYTTNMNKKHQKYLQKIKKHFFKKMNLSVYEMFNKN